MNPKNYYGIIRTLNSVSMINKRDIIILLYIFFLISLWINITLVTDIIVRIFLFLSITFATAILGKESTAVFDNGL